MKAEGKKQKPKQIEAEKLIGQIIHRHKGVITHQQTILYALALGFSQDPLKVDDFKFTNEIRKNFMVFPFFGTVAHKLDFLQSLYANENMPHFHSSSIRHAEQNFIMVQDSIQLGVEYEHECQVVDVISKGSRSILCYQIRSYSKKQGKRQLAFICHIKGFIGLSTSGFKGKNFLPSPPSVPKRKEDILTKVQTFPNQAIIYRLTGDQNPLHIDPDFATEQKLEKPILHGMATYGSTAKVFIQEVLKNDPKRFKSFNARFVGYVYPGECLVLRIWKEEGDKYILEAETEVRKTKVLVGAIDLKPEAKL